ncbi:MAG: lysophospholipid acyltransferase family protein [Flavobacteriales bacterium]|nr:lysophospholipid acyltransferase family protein [Flavobacteriales bacterium]
MKALVFYLSLPLLYLISLLPYPLFYGLCDGIFFLVYHVFGYRKQVVRTNLKNAFPEKSEKERRKIERMYFRYLVDLMLETFKTLTISKKSALKKCEATPEAVKLFNEYHDKGQSVIIVMGHYGNWEWAGNTFSLSCKSPLYIIYHPLRNPYFDRLMYKMRTRFGNRLYPMKEAFKGMVANRKEVNVTAFIADQTPSPENAYWTTFLHQDTPVFWGTERLACKLDYPIVYITIDRYKRGRYRIHAKKMIEKPSLTREGEISEMHTRLLEEDIRRRPEIWLWSHKRWKHKRPAISQEI